MCINNHIRRDINNKSMGVISIIAYVLQYAYTRGQIPQSQYGGEGVVFYIGLRCYLRGHCGITMHFQARLPYLRQSYELRDHVITDEMPDRAMGRR
jgi:hypothetical protein